METLVADRLPNHIQKLTLYENQYWQKLVRLYNETKETNKISLTRLCKQIGLTPIDALLLKRDKLVISEQGYKKGFVKWNTIPPNVHMLHKFLDSKYDYNKEHTEKRITKLVSEKIVSPSEILSITEDSKSITIVCNKKYKSILVELLKIKLEE